MHMTTSIKQWLLSLALVFTLLLGVQAAAQDRVELKDGRAFEGQIVREVEGYIWIRARMGGLEKELMFTPSEIQRIEKSSAAPQGGAAEARPASAAAEAPKPRKTPGVPRAAILSIGEGQERSMIGLHVTAASLEQVIPTLEQDGVEIVVFHVNSGGGSIEFRKMAEVIHEKFKPKFRVVAWIESAISAAAMAVHCVEEIYFMPQGNYGACTGYSGSLEAIAGRQEQEILYLMERISRMGRHNTLIMRAMQIMQPLSATIDEHGDVHWSASTDGQYVVNAEGRVLTLRADEAVKFRFARGIARDIKELGRLMGYNEIEWVGREVPGARYPISRAEEAVRRFRAQTYEDEQRANEHFMQYQTSMELARGLPPEERGRFLGRASSALDRLEAGVRNNPNLPLFVMGMMPEQFKDWLEEQREEIRRLRRR
jgi:hypothetical protein